MYCDNPQRIFNKYLGHYVVVPCGKCDSCKITRSNSLASRVAHECEKHNYNIFFTLTYDNKHIPYISKDGNLCSRDGRFVDGLSFSSERLYEKYLSSIKNIMSDRPFQPIEKFGEKVSIGVLIKYDIQNFIKRVRSAVEYEFIDNKKLKSNGKYYSKSDIGLRYFVCGEMGTKTFRPHYHGLFHTNDVQVAEFVRKNILESWKYCDWDVAKRLEQKDGRKRLPSYARGGSASSYVASYVNSINSSSNVLENGFFRSFVLFSKRPLYGLSKIDEEILCDAIREFDCNPCREIQRCIKGELSTSVHVLQSFVLRSLFPRYNGIDNESFKDKLQLCIFDSKNPQRHNFVCKAKRFIRDFLKVPFDSVSVTQYLMLYEKIMAGVKSFVLKQWMLTFRSEKPLEYIKSAYHTMEDNIFDCYFDVKYNILQNFDVDLFNHPLRLNDFGGAYEQNIKSRKLKYAAKLLPKHYNSIIYHF